ncbi:unnamed protein product [Protopolystoma xenopodis]|uniref:Bcl-2 Bcl-2 homology region 1-3 domain-containing protein n=1 Tax=Protopolystoma xenopodis TaxID=117903 RepID=A0A3S5ASX5_9PLAT|nr:unnamed protein product [Protopolystoma xenopodis]
MQRSGTSQNSLDLFTEQSCNLIRGFASTRLDIDNKSPRRQDLEKPHKSELLTAIVRLVQEFSRRYQERFDPKSLAETIHINPENFSIKEFVEFYEGVLTNLFSDINWGHIVGMLAFFHLLIDQLAALKLASEVDTLTSVTSSFVNTHLRDWITTHGGWVSTPA